MFGRKRKQDDDFLAEQGYYEDYRYDDYDDGYREPGYDDPRYDDPRYRDSGYRESAYQGADYVGGRSGLSAYHAGYGDDDYDTDDYAIYDYDTDYGADEAAEYADEAVDDGYGDHRTADSGPRTGPYDYDDVADLIDDVGDQRLDLGSIILPVPEGGQLQVEMTPEGAPQAVHLATEHGRLTVAAYAAPKSPGQWRSVVNDLSDSLRNDGAQVSVQSGPWGRELHAITQGADLRFIGVDGYRWMLRMVAAGPTGAADEGHPLVQSARTVLAETVVRRDEQPLPVREPLPVVLPQQLAEQLTTAHQQQMEAQQRAQAEQAAAARAHATGQYSPVTPDQPPHVRRAADGSAMQQLRRG